MNDNERIGLAVESLIDSGLAVDSADPNLVRQWITVEQRRRKNRSRAGLLSTMAMLLALISIGWMISFQATQVREMVGHQPSLALIQLDETTQQLCDASPAEYFVRQLGNRRVSSGISSSQ